MDVVIPYKPRYPEIHTYLEQKRFTVLVAHRRFGKTVLSVNHLIKSAMLCKKPRGMFAYIGPFRIQAKSVAWAYLKHYTAALPNIKINEGELSITLPTGSTVRIFGADNPDSLRGLYFDGVILDEVAQMRSEVWFEIIRPALSDRLGWALFLGTPKGINLFYDLYQIAQTNMRNGDKDWLALSYPVTETSVLPAEEVEEMRASLSDAAFRQEMMCDFGASSSDVLIPLDLIEKGMTSPARLDEQMDWPLVVGVDIARYGDDATVIFPRRGLYAYNEPVILHNMSNVEVAHYLVEWIAVHRPDHVMIDQGQGTGVIDLVQSLVRGRDVTIYEIPFGSRANNADKFANRRAEMYYNVREWLRTGGHIPNSLFLESELSAATYEIDPAGRIKLEPKDKIKEKLRRSPDCFVAGTMVATKWGNKPIEEIKVGDIVITPYGYRTVIKTWEVETSTITTATNGNVELTGKPRHKVFTFNKGWVELGSLKSGDDTDVLNFKGVFSWAFLNALYTKASNTGFKVAAATMKVETKIKRKDFYIVTSGHNTMGRSLRVMSCIIKTATGLITALKIWSLWKAGSILRSTCGKICKTLNTVRALLKPSIKRKRQQQYGIDLKRVLNGIANMARIRGSIGSPQEPCVQCAGENTTLSFHQDLDSVPMLANKKKAINDTKPQQVYVRIAEKSLSTTNTRSKSVALGHAQTGTGRSVKVYNLTLDEDNVYYANGLLVENCADALALTFAVAFPAKSIGLKAQYREYGRDVSDKMGNLLQGFYEGEESVF